MRLYLVQHGEAVAKEIDADRPLSEQGKLEVSCIADFLNRAGIRLSTIFHSGKTRARQTAEIIAAVIAPDNKVSELPDINPNDAVDPLINRLEGWQEETMIVGHLPFMAKLVSRLVITEEGRIITAYQPGSVVCLSRDGADHWQIQWMIRPELFNH